MSHVTAGLSTIPKAAPNTTGLSACRSPFTIKSRFVAPRANLIPNSLSLLVVDCATTPPSPNAASTVRASQSRPIAILFVLCWPLAPHTLVLYPVVWLMLLCWTYCFICAASFSFSFDISKMSLSGTRSWGIRTVHGRV